MNETIKQSIPTVTLAALDWEAIHKEEMKKTEEFMTGPARFGIPQEVCCLSAI